MASDLAMDQKKLPKSLQKFYSIDLIRNPEVSNDEKETLVKNYGENCKDWAAPKSDRVKDFALDMILY